MPRIKRWFPVSHDINGDPEVIELMERFDLPGLKIWLQLLSIGDRNDGRIAGEIDWICKSFLYLFTSNSRRYGTKWRQDRCKMVLEWMQDKHWISIKQDSILLNNYAKYHRTEERKPVPPDQTEPDRPLKDHKNEAQPASPEPSADPKNPNGLDPEIKKYADAIFRSDTQKFSGLIRWIKQAQKNNWPDPSIALALSRFTPYADSVKLYWPYLDKLIEKADKDLSLKSHNTEHEKQTAETKETAQILNLKGVIKNAKT